MIVISPNLVLSPVYAESAWLPAIGWQNLVTITNVAATSADADYPVTNLANPNTTLHWESLVATEQYLTVTLSTDQAIDYLAVARHNFGTAGIICSVEGLTADDGAVWEELCPEQTLADDAPVLFRFVPTVLIGVRLRLQPSGTAPEAAVMYVGKLLVCQRSVQVGHVPLPMGRRRTMINNRSEDGEFLGTVQTGEGLSTSADLQNFEPAWFRENFKPFLDAAPPFFFAWNPLYYPDEVGYAWLTNDPQPQLSHLVGYISVTLQMDGLAL
jgi:hypothetical protein